MTTKNELIKIIEKKEKQLHAKEQEMSAWNSGKYKTDPKAKASTIYVESLRKEIKEIREELKKL